MTQLPLAIFDTMERVDDEPMPEHCQSFPYAELDYEYTMKFLLAYNGSRGTFNAYRREVERLIHWAWLVQGKSISQLKRADIEDFLNFCKKPPKDWIGLVKKNRFISKEGLRIPNPEWRPFVVTIPKASRRMGQEPSIKDYALSATALKEIFAILGSFYNFLIQEELIESNPVSHVRQKSKHLRKQQGKPKVRRLTELQWEYVIETAELMAEKDPAKHEKSVFILSALYSMYLRISELAESERWTPKMCDFHRDQDNRWWFTTVGKGNKERQIAVSDAMLKSLRRWREHLNLSPLPSPGDTSPILPKTRGKGAISDTSYIRKIVQRCFDESIARLKHHGFNDEAAMLNEATVHWLRHTGISEDVKIRPREHVRDDAGHSSGAITDRYIDIELRERHRSAKNKLIKQDDQ